jgi:hypothetical protein
MLQRWVSASKVKNLPTCFPDDLLVILTRKAETGQAEHEEDLMETM